VNEELTADEWKKRYEKERERNSKLKTRMEKLEEELRK
jgi:kinesin family protein 5